MKLLVMIVFLPIVIFVGFALGVRVDFAGGEGNSTIMAENSSRSGAGSSAPWITAYYAGWNQNSLPPGSIDYSAVTHIIHFSIYPTQGGNVDGTQNGITRESAAAAVGTAHAAGKKILLTCGGWGSDKSFDEATSPANRRTFVNNLVHYMQQSGYDGLDIDWEPVTSPAQFKQFIPELRRAMKAANPASLLTTAAFSFDKAVVEMKDYFDQINLMTYDMSGPWPAWISWHNSPVYDGGYRFPSTGNLLPSMDGRVNEYIKAGVPAAKLGIGIDFYGYVWSGGTGTSTGGVTKPRQAWTTPPIVKSNVAYSAIMDSYGMYPVRYDSVAQAVYISIDAPQDEDDKFISFENEKTMFEKAAYVRQKGLGGVILYELAAGYRPGLPPGQRDPLLQAVKSAFGSGTPPPDPPVDAEKPSISIKVPADNMQISGTIRLLAEATDNVFVAGVQFTLDNRMIGTEVTGLPYSVQLNTWRFSNGSHTLVATARDTWGNTNSAARMIRINNDGPPPPSEDKIIYADALAAPFTNTSWGAVPVFDNSSTVKSGRASVRVDFTANGAFDLLSGTWGAESPIDPGEYDSLKCDIYPTSNISLGVGFYNNHSATISLVGNQWNTVAVPLDFREKFSRFYFQHRGSGPMTCYFDNIRFSQRIFRATR
jgi:chitinase